MSITNTTQLRSGDITQVTVTSSLTGTVYYYWYLDGNYVGFTTQPTKSFMLASGGQAVVACLDSNSSPDVFNPVASAPAGYPAVRRLEWVRSIDASIGKYRIEQQLNGGSWTILGYVADDRSHWLYHYTTPRLTDLQTYAWRVIPMSASGNDGTSLSLGSEKIVRTPDAPRFSVTFIPATTKVTLAAA